MIDPDSGSSSAPSPKMPYPEWQADYQAALLELDPEKLAKRVEGRRNRNLQPASDHFAKLG
jgi:hypothetical protein